jgi:hypothetical protein
MNNTLFWGFASCCLIEVYPKFRKNVLHPSAEWALKIGAVGSSETSVNFYQATRTTDPTILIGALEIGPKKQNC